MEIIITTKSDKNNNWCVGGIRTADGSWIRPVRTGDDDSLTDENLVCTNGHIAGVLDVVDIDIAPGDAVALHPHQVENVFMNTNVRPRYLRTATWDEVFRLHAPESRNMILNNNTRYNSDRLPYNFVNNMSYKRSIMLAAVKNLDIMACEPGKSHPKAEFDYVNRNGESLHYRLTVTDPEYFNNGVIKSYRDACIIVSLAGEPYQGDYYLLAAQIIPQ